MGNEDQLLYDTLLVIKIISHNLQFAYIYVYIYIHIYLYIYERLRRFFKNISNNPFHCGLL